MKKKVWKRVQSAKEKITTKKQASVEYGPIEVRMISEKKEDPDETASENELFDELNGIEQNDAYKFESNRNYFTISVYALVTIALASLVILLMANYTSVKNWLRGLGSVLSPFFFGFFIAFILNPLIDWFEKTVFARWLKVKSPKIRLGFSVLIVYLATFGLLVIALVFVVPQLTESVVGIATDVTNALTRMYDNRDEYTKWLQEYFPEIDFVYLESKVEEMWPTILSTITNLTKDIVPKLLGMTFSVAKGAINTLLAIAISIYILFDKRKLKRMGTQTVYALFPTDRAKLICHTTDECGNIFSNFISGKALDSLIIGIICFIAMTILGLDYALLLSVIVGITNMIPYFGPFIGAVPGVLLYLCIKPVDVFVFVIMIFILQQFDGWILGPKILGDSTGLSPLWVIFGITLGGAYGGVMGMFLGVPIVAVAAYLLNLCISAALRKKRIEVS